MRNREEAREEDLSSGYKFLFKVFSSVQGYCSWVMSSLIFPLNIYNYPKHWKLLFSILFLFFLAILFVAFFSSLMVWTFQFFISVCFCFFCRFHLNLDSKFWNGFLSRKQRMIKQKSKRCFLLNLCERRDDPHLTTFNILNDCCLQFSFVRWHKKSQRLLILASRLKIVISIIRFVSSIQ